MKCHLTLCEHTAQWKLYPAGIEPGVAVWWYMNDEAMGSCGEHLHDILRIIQQTGHNRDYEKNLFFVEAI